MGPPCGIRFGRRATASWPRASRRGLRAARCRGPAPRRCRGRRAGGSRSRPLIAAGTPAAATAASRSSTRTPKWWGPGPKRLRNSATTPPVPSGCISSICMLPLRAKPQVIGLEIVSPRTCHFGSISNPTKSSQPSVDAHRRLGRREVRPPPRSSGTARRRRGPAAAPMAVIAWPPPRTGWRRGSPGSRCSGRGCPTARRGSRRRSGRGCRARNAVTETTKPGVQNPHCRPWWSRNAACTGVEVAVAAPGPRPS